MFFLPLGTEGSIPDKRDLINSMIQLLTGQCMNSNEVKDGVKVRVTIITTAVFVEDVQND